MDSTISYITNNGEIKSAIVPEELADENVELVEDIDTYQYRHPLTGVRYRLHSVGDAPALIEGPDNRTHWLHMGKLHRTKGPAFTCEENAEYYAFGLHLEERIFKEVRGFLAKLEEYCFAHNIALHEDARTGTEKYFIDYASLASATDAAKMLSSGAVFMTHFDSYESQEFTLQDVADAESDIDSERSERGSPLLATLVGLAVGYTAKAAYSEIKKNRQVSVGRQA